MNALKSGHVAILCSLILSGTALYIHLDSKAQRIKQGEKPVAWQPPATDKIISEADAFLDAPKTTGDIFDQVARDAPNQKRLLTDREVGFAPAATNPNGTPLGAWAATLVRITNAIESNLFRDPATGKLIHLVNGQFFEEKDPYMALSILETSNLSALRLAEPVQTHDYMNDYYQLEALSQNRRVISQNEEFLFQNKQAIDEMRQLRYDYERDSLRNSFNR